LKESLLKITSENTSQIDKKETENEEQNVEQLLEKIEEYKESEYCIQETNNSIIPKEEKENYEEKIQMIIRKLLNENKFLYEDEEQLDPDGIIKINTMPTSKERLLKAKKKRKKDMIREKFKKKKKKCLLIKELEKDQILIDKGEENKTGMNTDLIKEIKSVSLVKLKKHPDRLRISVLFKEKLQMNSRKSS
jgi:hypothetical protein